MIEIKPYTPGCLEEWDRFVDDSKTPLFMFKRGFMDYHSDRFVDASLMFYYNSELIAILPASLHNNQLTSQLQSVMGTMVKNVLYYSNYFDRVNMNILDIDLSNEAVYYD